MRESKEINVCPDQAKGNNKKDCEIRPKRDSKPPPKTKQLLQRPNETRLPTALVTGAGALASRCHAAATPQPGPPRSAGRPSRTALDSPWQPWPNQRKAPVELERGSDVVIRSTQQPGDAVGQQVRPRGSSRIVGGRLRVRSWFLVSGLWEPGMEGGREETRVRRKTEAEKEKRRKEQDSETRVNREQRREADARDIACRGRPDRGQQGTGSAAGVLSAVLWERAAEV